jgi:hypothetical protein
MSLDYRLVLIRCKKFPKPGNVDLASDDEAHSFFVVEVCCRFVEAARNVACLQRATGDLRGSIVLRLDALALILLAVPVSKSTK